jgi:endonuclease-3
MPRKTPRSRRRNTTPKRVPGPGRSRAKPGARAGTRKAASAVPRHAGGAGGATPARAKARTTARRPVRTARASRGRFVAPDPARVQSLLAGLRQAYPGAHTALDFGTPLQLLIATILSAQCTDERVNMVTPALFERYPDAAAFAHADRAELEEMIRSTGFFRNKAKAIQTCCRDIVEQHGGEVPRTLEALTALHGVGRKTANVVLGNAFGIPGLVVDTHVTRLANRLGLVREMDAVKIEFALMPIIPREDWSMFSHWLILHGRRVCIARKPRCTTCPIAAHCPRIGVTVSQ